MSRLRDRCILLAAHRSETGSPRRSGKVAPVDDGIRIDVDEKNRGAIET